MRYLNPGYQWHYDRAELLKTDAKKHPTLKASYDMLAAENKYAAEESKIRHMKNPMITEGDKSFIHALMRKYNIPNIKIQFSNSKAKFPDIWVYPNERRIVVTNEWAKQDTHERRKRLVHEIVGHIVKGMRDNISGLRFYSHPEKDEWSKKQYRKEVNPINLSGKVCPGCRMIINKNDCVYVNKSMYEFNRSMEGSHSVRYRHHLRFWHYNCLVRHEAQKFYERLKKDLPWSSLIETYDEWDKGNWDKAVEYAKDIVKDYYISINC